jgi:NADH:ubiquinone oxidoreductase subunit K
VAVFAHGLVGHRWFTAQLRSVEMQPTPLSTRLFGEGDVSSQVFGLTWHIVTAVFLVSAAAFYLSAFGALESRDVLRFIAIIHAAFLAVGLFYIEKRLDVLRGRIPSLFVISMVAVASLGWAASNSVQSG